MSVPMEGDKSVSDRLRELELSFASTTATILARLDGIAESIKSDGGRHDDHEARLRAAETTLTTLKVKVALISGGTGTVGGIVTAVVAQLVGG